jgi:hypothetical protein
MTCGLWVFLGALILMLCALVYALGFLGRRDKPKDGEE